VSKLPLSFINDCFERGLANISQRLAAECKTAGNILPA